MSDLEKFKELFNNIGLMYSEYDYSSDETTVTIDDAHIIKHGYGNCLDICFNKDGSFKEFSPWGE